MTQEEKERLLKLYSGVVQGRYITNTRQKITALCSKPLTHPGSAEPWGIEKPGAAIVGRSRMQAQKSTPPTASLTIVSENGLFVNNFFQKVIDFFQICDRLEIEKVLPVDGQAPISYKEVTACLEAGRLLLFCDLNNQTCKADKYKTKLEQFIKGYHIDHPLSCDQGREVSPLKQGLTAYRYGSTTIRVPQYSPKCKKESRNFLFVFCEMRPAGSVLCAGAGWYEGQKFYLIFSFEYFRGVPDGATECHKYGNFLGQFWVTDTTKPYCKAIRNITELTEKQGKSQHPAMQK